MPWIIYWIVVSSSFMRGNFAFRMVRRIWACCARNSSTLLILRSVMLRVFESSMLWSIDVSSLT